MLEVLITVAILGILVLLAAPFAGKIIRRSQSVAAFSSIRQTLGAARLQAVKRGFNVVVQFKVTPEGQIQAHTFQDRANTEAALTGPEQAAVGDFKQSTFTPPDDVANEPTLGDVTLPSSVAVRRYGGTEGDPDTGIAFDKYNGDTSLIDLVAFLPTGGIAPPEAATSGLPSPADGRGIYFADHAGKNFFRVTIDSDVSGRIVVDKYQDGAGYRSSGWTWY